MPHFEKTQKDTSMPSAALAAFMRATPVSNDALAHEVSELRKEIAALRADLAPVPSLILTGRQVLDEFKRMRK